MNDNRSVAVHEEHATDELLAVQVVATNELDRGDLRLDERKECPKVLLRLVGVTADDDIRVLVPPDEVLVQVTLRVDHLELGCCRGRWGAHE